MLKKTPALSLGESLSVFHFFIFSFFHVFISSDVFGCFHCWLYLFTSLHCLLGTWFLCCYCCTTSATDLRPFLTLRRFLPCTPSRHLAKPAFIKASLSTSTVGSIYMPKPPHGTLINLSLVLNQRFKTTICW